MYSIVYIPSVIQVITHIMQNIKTEYNITF